MGKRALITGVTGQDGSYLAELLLSKGYEVHGLVRRVSSPNYERLGAVLDRIRIHSGDLADSPSLSAALAKSRPHEVYNLAGQSFVPASVEQPILTGDVTGLGVARLLAAIRAFDPAIRFYQASSSEMFGKVKETPQRETTPLHPRSPYAVAKVYAHHITMNYRESFGLFACSGILFNHESPRRGLEFVTRKVSHGVASIRMGLSRKLELGNLDAKRDWGYAGDYVEAMWRMLQQKKPGDYVIATGESRTVRELVEIAFDHVGLDWKRHVSVAKRLFRPAEVDRLCGDASRARKELGWRPKVRFESLVRMMVDADLARLRGRAARA